VEKDYTTRRFVLFTPHQITKYYLSDQIKKNYIGGACDTYGIWGVMHTGFWWGDLRERTAWKT
jgi:hypothetical protein